MTVLRKAMVFAAGLGTRMRPLTDNLPKPLLEVAGRTILERILDGLEKAGVEEAVVNTHYFADQIEAKLARRRCPKILRSHEDDLLETGGGIAKALPLLGPGPFYVVNGDVLWSDGARDTLLRLAQSWKDSEMDVLLLVHPVVRSYGYRGPGDFFLDQLGRVRRRRVHEVAPFVFTGIQILHPRLFEGAPSGRFSLNRLFDRAIESSRLFAIVHDGDWFHIGTPRDLTFAEVEFGNARKRQ